MAEIPLDEEDFDSAAMAAAMGFSSFGGPASKKRKFNPRADAAVVASPASAVPAPAPSGANTTALGERQPRRPAPPSNLPLHPASLPAARPPRGGGAPPAAQNSDEIDLDGGDEDDDDREPQYLDTSRPARRLSSAEREAREMQERIDAIVTAKVDETMAHAQAPDSVPTGDVHGAARGGGHSQRHHRGGGQHPGRGEPGHVWWEGYHDPSFNENPWEWLEKERGLEPRGTWIPRVARSG